MWLASVYFYEVSMVYKWGIAGNALFENAKTVPKQCGSLNATIFFDVFV